MHDKIVITCALTGGGDTTGISRYVPVTPSEIATEAIAAAKAGAAVVHIHVREPSTGMQSMRLELYREVVDRIRDAGTDVLINLTTGPGARFTPSDQNPKVATRDSTMATPEARTEHILALKPDICSLDVATFNFGRHAFVNVPDHLEKMARLIDSAGVKPELETFDLGHVRHAADLVAKGFVKRPPLFQLCLGIPWGAPADTETMALMKSHLPKDAIWAAFGISRQQFPMVAQAAVLGGHVRVGLEDNLYMAHGELAQGNAPLVARAKRIIEELGAQAANAQEARKLLGIAA